MLFNEYPYTNYNDYNLDWLIKTARNLLDRMDATEKWQEEHQKAYQELKDLYDAVMSGNFPPSIQKAFEKWMRENALDLVGELVKTVFFGLTETGYFCAYIPESWDDIKFGTTGLDDFPECFEEFGHLTLTY